MNAQALIFNQFGEVLLVQQMTKRGAVIWNFPGGGVEMGETFEEAVIREVLEETGFHVKIVKKVYENNHKTTFLCEIIDSVLQREDDPDILDVQWVSLEDRNKFDDKLLEILSFYPV